jgi:hypothetical protein
MTARDDLRALRADALLDLLAGDDAAGHATTVAGVYQLRDLRGWQGRDISRAIGDLVEDGRIALRPARRLPGDPELIVRPRAER